VENYSSLFVSIFVSDMLAVLMVKEGTSLMFM
jgi:hypothetical protein